MRYPFRYALSRILPLVLPACLVDAPIVEGSDDRLGDGLGRWCESMCERAASCGAADDPETCPDDCAEFFTETFIDQTDVCSESALHVMDCLDSQTCEAIIDGECHIDDEADRCAISQGDVVCRALDLGEGGHGGAGGTAGTAGTGGTPTLSCELGIANCSDGKSYRLVCASNQCHCIVDDSVESSFSLDSLECPGPDEAIASCGWSVTTIRDDTDSPGAVCSAYDGASGGSGSNACSFSFSDCDNRLTYSLDCSGAPGGGQCSCLVDGVAIGTLANPEDVCPYLTSESDTGVLAIYDACGFEIVVL